MLSTKLEETRATSPDIPDVKSKLKAVILKNVYNLSGLHYTKKQSRNIAFKNHTYISCKLVLNVPLHFLDVGHACFNVTIPQMVFSTRTFQEKQGKSRIFQTDTTFWKFSGGLH